MFDLSPRMTTVILFSFLLMTTVRAHLVSRIVGGQESVEHRWPLKASIEYRLINNYVDMYFHICGGSLIAPGLILTAAHCFEYNEDPSYYRVVLGEHDRNLTSGREQTIYVDLIIKHEHYDANLPGYPNDIALLTLPSDATINEYVQLVPMSTKGDVFSGNDDCWLAGWGKTAVNGMVSEQLMEVKINVITNAECKDRYKYISETAILNTHICAFEEGKAVCNGDSGGPLVCMHGDQYILVGVISWRLLSCHEYPSVCQRVSEFRDWITAKTAQLLYNLTFSIIPDIHLVLTKGGLLVA